MMWSLLLVTVRMMPNVKSKEAKPLLLREGTRYSGD